MNPTIFDKTTIDKFVKEILSSTQTSFTPEEKDKLAEQLRQQLSTAVTVSLVNALDESARKEFITLVESGKPPEELITYVKSKLNKPEDIAIDALTKFKEDFIQTYSAKKNTAV